MSEYAPKNITKLIRRRELGLPLKESGTAVKRSRNNYRCDYEFLKSLLCDHDVYLEVIACRKVSNAAEPSFCHNRLFTNNYHSWFNLCTSPTSGPRLIKTNVFSEDECTRSQPGTASDRIKILDAVILNRPNGCNPLANSQHKPCVLLLAKNGWLYQFSLDDAALLNKVYIPTDSFADEFTSCHNNTSDPSSPTCKANTSTRRRLATDINFNYRYVSITGAEGKVIVCSSAFQQDCLTFVAHAVFSLFPLRLDCHFVTTATKQNLKAEIWNDIFVISSVKGSTVSLFGFRDIQKLHHIDASNANLHATLYQRDLLGKITAEAVGSQMVGCPYTMQPVDLDRWENWSSIQLFKTKAQRHILRVGGIPYHYAVPVDKVCTAWSLRGLSDGKEISRFHLDEKLDNSHITDFDFHSDESGRIFMVNKTTVTMLAIEQVKCDNRRRKSCVEMSPSKDAKKIKHEFSPSSSCQSPKHFPPRQEKLLKGYPIAEVDCHLRVVGSIHTKMPVSYKTRCRVVKCFEIDVTKSSPWEPLLQNAPDKCDDDTVNWAYPKTPRSLSGRSLRQRRYSMETLMSCVICVSYEDDMDVLAVLHYKYAPMPHGRHRSMESCADLVLSLYDNLTGERMNCVIVEQDLVPNNEVGISVVLDEDTVIYTRPDGTNVLNYKIMRFCRKP